MKTLKLSNIFTNIAKFVATGLGYAVTGDLPNSAATAENTINHLTRK